MSRRWRLVVFALGCLGVAAMVVMAALRAPDVGASEHPYRDRAVAAALQHATANVVSSVNFDQRAFDTFGEELILLTAVIGATVLLRPAAGERDRQPRDAPAPLDAVRLTGYVLLPVTLVVGVDVVTHGAVSPGGGFQGGVVLAAGIHLLYLSGSYRTLDRVRPVELFELGEAVGAAAFAVTGILAALVSTAFLANFLPTGRLGQLASAGTVPLLNAAVGVAVASGVVVLLARFLEKALVIEGSR